MSVSKREISRQMKVSKTAASDITKNFKKSTFNDSKKIGRPSIFNIENKCFIKKRESQSPESSAEKNTPKTA